MTVHFIDKSWELCSRVLLTSEMPERHTAENIASRLTQAAEEWDIKPMSISAVIHDNAANANSGIGLMGWPHFGCNCVVHTLQLCIKSGLEGSTISQLLAAPRIKACGTF